jgi:hypothetical protein
VHGGGFGKRVSFGVAVSVGSGRRIENAERLKRGSYSPFGKSELLIV